MNTARHGFPRLQALTPAAIGASLHPSNAVEHEDGTDGLGGQRGFAFPRGVSRGVGNVVSSAQSAATRGDADGEAT